MTDKDDPGITSERAEQLLDFAQDGAAKITEGMFGRPHLMPSEVLTVLSLVAQDVCFRRAYCLSSSDDYRKDKEFKAHLITGLVWLSHELKLLAAAHADGTVEAAGAAEDAKQELQRIVRNSGRRRKRKSV